MTVEELTEKDETFSESEILSKASMTYMMLLNSVMIENLDRIKHKLGTAAYSNINNYIACLKERNQRKIYEEPIIKKTEIKEITENDKYYIVKIELYSKYISYIIDKKTEKILIGDKYKIIEQKNIMTFMKGKNSIEEEIIKKCPNCGASMDINSTGICQYCHKLYDTNSYDWILVNIERE